MIPPFLPIPTHWLKRYHTFRAIMYLAILAITIFFGLQVIFPTLEQQFDFRSPESSKNTLKNPRSPENIVRINGKIEQNGTLIADTPAVGDFSQTRTTAILEKNSPVPETIDLTLRRSYQSFFYPTGQPVTDFPSIDRYQQNDPLEMLETLYVVDGTYYAPLARRGGLYPFVSEQAFLSRYPKEKAFTTDKNLFYNYSISDEWLGFRVGSLLGNATGVFVVVSETEVRPVGSAEIFLALGYNFDDVIPVSEEELGIYKRGKILLLGDVHPDGTLLLDQDTDTYFLIDQGTKRPLVPGEYQDFLTNHIRPILVSTKASKQTATCTLVPNIFGTKLSCTTLLSSFTPGFGNDFRIELQNGDTAIELDSLSVAFETAKNTQNILTLLSQIKQRLISRFLP